MMSPDLMVALASLGITICAFVAAMIQRERAQTRTVMQGDQQVEKDLRIELQTTEKEIRTEMADTERDLRTQIGVMNDRLTALNERTVRRDDLDKHIDRIETLINSGQAEQRETNKRIDMLLNIMANKPVTITAAQ